MTAEKVTPAPSEVHWDTVVLHQSEPRPSPLADGVGSALGVVAAVGAVSAAVTAVMLVAGGVGAAFLHLVWGTTDPARSDEVIEDFLAVLPEAATTLLVTWLLTGAAVGGLHLVDRSDRKRQPARILGGQLRQAPEELRRPMSDAILAVERIKGSRAFRDGMFTDLDLRAAMWDLGTQVLAATELHEAMTAAAGTGSGTLTPEEGRTYTRAHAQIEQAARELRQAADTVADLDTDLAAADTAARVADERARQLAESDAHVVRLAHAHTAAQASTSTAATTVTDLTDTITTRAHAYRTLPRP
ncbi:hypothetical protein JWS13_05060 (plasmid) [Rhodococcus pseudokoreensis]|uniref:Uncharacterized protein n=1 Tax=Rhodococcus pseudokoreensis TaxID=2811421 RepID=A0A974ZRS2_9NOCA|nr:hypothetical protein [Rhodococcus pseudokoreensis]QSE88031.1 hypothetical protein JWS13_05060 [Rhodococcus pseudokoreensis]